MISKLSLRSIDPHSISLRGTWIWLSNSKSRWNIKVLSSVSQIERVRCCWSLNCQQGMVMARVNKDQLCRHLGLKQLLLLEPNIAMHAAAIALQYNELASVLGLKNHDPIIISKNNENVRNIQFLHALIWPDAAPENEYSNQIEVEISIDVLMEHVATGCLLPQDFEESADFISPIDIYTAVLAVVGKSTLQASDLKLLIPGSLILLDKESAFDKTISFKIDNLTLNAIEDVHEGGWRVNNFLYDQDPYFIEQIFLEPNPVMKTEIQINLANIPMEIMVRLAGVQLNVAEIMRIQNGSVLSLKMPKNAFVDLVCNGKIIAQGELVELDGALAVEIIKINNSL
jgi:flagellar motor switch/type III secretory pathway protein FliN